MEETLAIRILHLEDSSLDAELTREYLEQNSIEADITRIFRLEEFRNYLESPPDGEWPDVILADYKMPGFDGLMALKMTREKNPDIPFILLSGAVGEELAVELLRSGATDYVLKNNINRLAPVVRRAMEEYNIKLRERQSQEEIREARDEAQKANSAKSRFLSRVSHELRTPLNAIIGYAHLLQADPLTEEQQHCSDQILKAGEHLLGLINEVLDITRIESGVLSTHIEPMAINTVIVHAVDLIKPLARSANVDIIIEGGPCELVVMGDRDRLVQVIINLVTNAVKYNRPGGKVNIDCRAENGGSLKMMVRDNGLGIPPHKMERLFTPFDRLDREKESTIPGTGLGLAVTKSLVETMGGAMGVVSSENEGSIFWVELPLANVQENSPEHQGLFSQQDGPCRVMLFTSDGSTAGFLSKVFGRQQNMQFSCLTMPDDVVNRLEQDNPDVLIVDLAEPEAAESVFGEIQNHDHLQQVPIIGLSTDEVDLTYAAYSHCRSVLAQPININTLLETIRELQGTARQTDGV